MFGKKVTISRSRSNSLSQQNESLTTQTISNLLLQRNEDRRLTMSYLLPESYLISCYTNFIARTESISAGNKRTGKNKEIEDTVFNTGNVVFIDPQTNAALLFKTSPLLDNTTLTADQYCASLKNIIIEQSVSVYGLIRLTKNPKDMRPHQLDIILNGKSAYALFGSTLYYIDTYAKIKKISSHMETIEKIKPLFPKDSMFLERLSLDKQEKIQKFCDHSPKKSTLTTVFGCVSYRELYLRKQSLTPSILKKHGIQHYHLPIVDQDHYPLGFHLLQAALTAVECLQKGESIWVQCEEKKYGLPLVLAIMILIDYEDSVIYTTMDEIKKLCAPLLKKDPNLQIYNSDLEYLKTTFLTYYINPSKSLIKTNNYLNYFKLTIPYPEQIKSFQQILCSLEFKNLFTQTIGFKMLGHYYATFYHSQQRPCKFLQYFAESVLQATNDKWYADLILVTKTKVSDRSFLANFLTIYARSSNDKERREALFVSIKASIDEVLMHLTGYPSQDLELLQDMYERQLNFEMVAIRKLISFKPDASCVKFLNGQKKNFKAYPFLHAIPSIQNIIHSINTNSFWVFELFTDAEPEINSFIDNALNFNNEKTGKQVIDKLKALVKKDIMSQLHCDEETFNCIITYRFKRDYYETASETSTQCTSILFSP